MRRALGQFPSNTLDFIAIGLKVMSLSEGGKSIQINLAPENSVIHWIVLVVIMLIVSIGDALIVVGVRLFTIMVVVIYIFLTLNDS